jgi:hypothetical protein
MWIECGIFSPEGREETMPEFQTLSTQEVEQLKAHRVNLADLDPYLDPHMDYLNTLQDGEVTLEEGEKRKAVKRRTTVAVKQLDMSIKWRRSKDQNKLLFEVIPVAL